MLNNDTMAQDDLNKFDAQVQQHKADLTKLLDAKIRDKPSRRTFNKQIREMENQPNFHSLEKTAKAILNDSRDIIKTYETLQYHITKEEKEMKDEREKDQKQVDELLDRGKEVTLQRIKRMLPVTPGMSVVTSEAEEGEELRFFPQRAWGDKLQEVFRQTAKGVRRMVRELPKDDD